MKRILIKKLNQLNKNFYEKVGTEFSQTRQSAWLGWKRLLPLIEGYADELKILDVGCGNGRFGVFISKHVKVPIEYVGVDNNIELLSEAKLKLQNQCKNVSLVQEDIVEGNLVKHFEKIQFDVITLFGILHHVPGFENRKDIIASLCRYLSPGGLLVISAWQFDRSSKFLKEGLKFSTLVKKQLKIDGLEKGDYFLGWNNLSETYRYCHLTTKDELTKLTEGLTLDLMEEFENDGREKNLNLYLVWRKRSPLYVER